MVAQDVSRSLVQGERCGFGASLVFWEVTSEVNLLGCCFWCFLSSLMPDPSLLWALSRAELAFGAVPPALSGRALARSRAWLWSNREGNWGPEDHSGLH